MPKKDTGSLWYIDFLCNNCGEIFSLSEKDFLKALVIPPTDYYKVIYLDVNCSKCGMKLNIKIGKDAEDEFKDK